MCNGPRGWGVVPCVKVRDPRAWPGVGYWGTGWISFSTGIAYDEQVAARAGRGVGRQENGMRLFWHGDRLLRSLVGPGALSNFSMSDLSPSPHLARVRVNPGRLT